MELLKLDSQRQASVLVENYDSLIWTERFNETGDFVLQTGNIEYFLNLLPEQTYVTLRESTVPMIVETHKIERKKNSMPILEIRGRSFESILDRRVAVPSLEDATGASNWTVNGRIPSDVAHTIILLICILGVADYDDRFPYEIVQFPTPADYLNTAGPVKKIDVSRGSLLNSILKLIQTVAPQDNSTSPITPAVVAHGLRSIRPNAAGTAIAIDIYTGVDRSASVYFDATRDLLDDGTYLFSRVGYSNVAYGVGEGFFAKMFKGPVVATGLERRVMLIDASASGFSEVELLRSEMSISLAEARETALFDGSINEDLSPYIYNLDYGLGDTVRIVGDYGLDDKAMVTEYIRSIDNTGYKAYPTLTTVV